MGEWGGGCKVKTPSFRLAAPIPSSCPRRTTGFGRQSGATLRGQDCSEKAEGRWPTEDLKDSSRVPWGARNLGHMCPMERLQEVISFQTLHFTNVDTRPREGSEGPGFPTCHGTTYKKNFL